MKHPNLKYFQIALLFLGGYIIPALLMILIIQTIYTLEMDKRIFLVIRFGGYAIMAYAVFLLVRKLMNRKLTA
jgi:hypothetical protein